MFQIEMLPACHGDCLWIEYGERGDIHRVLVDGGFGTAYPSLRARFEQLPEKDRHFELMVVSHVDADHIEGMVSLLADEKIQFSCGDFWFNGWDQIAGAGVDFGALQGEYLSGLIKKRGLPWNRLFEGAAVVVLKDEPFPVHDLPGGLRLTLLSPTPHHLQILAASWQDECKKAGLVPGVAKAALEHLEKHGQRLIPSFAPDAEPEVETWARVPFTKDSSVANGSSIAFLAEYGGHRVLLGADAYSDVLETNVPRLAKERGETVLALDAFKLPHHGSAANLSAALMSLVRAQKILVSTNGDHFNHPDPEALARVVKSGTGMELVFNYRSEENAVWDNADWKQRYGYRTVYPPDGKNGALIEFG
jgi:hypothetical protein